MTKTMPANRRYGNLKMGFSHDFDFIIYNRENIGELFCHKADCIGIESNNGVDFRDVPEDFVARKGMRVAFDVIQQTSRGPRANPWWFVDDLPPEPEPSKIDWSEYDGSSRHDMMHRLFGGRTQSRDTRLDVHEFHVSEMMRCRVRIEHEKRVAQRTDVPFIWGECTCLVYPERIYAQQESPTDRHPKMPIEATFYIYRVVRAHSNCPLHSYGNPIEFYIFRDNGEHPLDSEMVTFEGTCDDRMNPYGKIEYYWNNWLRTHGYSVDDGYDY